MALGGIWSRITGGIVALGVGAAARDAIDPVLEVEKQQAWARRAVKTLDAATAARADVMGFPSPVNFKDDAKRHGIGSARYDALVHLAYTFPTFAELDHLTNRGVISEDTAKDVFTRLGYPEPWPARLAGLFADRLTPDQVANAVQQGHMPNNGILPDIDPTIPIPAGYEQPPAPDDAGPSHVPLTQIPIDPIKEAAAAGIDEERLKVEANLSGLPPGPEALLAMWNRNLIDQEAVDAGIREGHMKTKWAHAFKRMRWTVLSGPEYAEAFLREWVTRDEMIKGGALTGHTPKQMDLLYKNRGRPASPTQIWTAWARKIIGPRGVPTDFTDHEEAIRRSNIRPEYAEMLWGIRYTYPPYFQVNRLVTSGAIDAATGADWLHKNRAAPEVVDAFTKFWEGGTTGTAQSARVKSAITAAVTEIRNAFILGNSDEGTVRGWLGRLDLADDADGLINVWTLMREVPQKGLTAAQVKKAFRGDPALHPRTWAIAQLMELGYTADDAAIYLDE